ncbi:hypothetical protein C8Q80DRAFT_169742 [Daedaleopsis nitida]|nr:hypothetical protein C8Q80DRAFT_169742 [Daedaleopsis nitida]
MRNGLSLLLGADPKLVVRGRPSPRARQRNANTERSLGLGSWNRQPELGARPCQWAHTSPFDMAVRTFDVTRPTFRSHGRRNLRALSAERRALKPPPFPKPGRLARPCVSRRTRVRRPTSDLRLNSGTLACDSASARPTLRVLVRMYGIRSRARPSVYMARVERRHAARSGRPWSSVRRRRSESGQRALAVVGSRSGAGAQCDSDSAGP